MSGGAGPSRAAPGPTGWVAGCASLGVGSGQKSQASLPLMAAVTELRRYTE